MGNKYRPLLNTGMKTVCTAVFIPGSARPQRLLCKLTDSQNALIEHLGLDLN